MSKHIPFFNNSERGISLRYIEIKGQNLFPGTSASIEIPNYCSFESIGSQFNILYISSVDEITFQDDDNLQKESHFGVTFQCTSCHRYISIEYVIIGLDDDNHNKTFIDSYDYSFTNSYFPFKSDQAEILSEIAPDFENIYRQASKAESMGLNEIDKMGYRKSAEFLAKGVLINVFEKSKDDVLTKTFGQNIKQLKECMDELEVSPLQLSSWIGNDGTHFLQENPDLSIDDMKNYIYDFASAVISDSHRRDAKEYIDKHYADNKKG